MKRSLSAMAITVVIVGGCAREPPPAPEFDRARASPSLAVASGVPLDHDLDSRTPVPLLAMMANHQKQNMRDHLVAVQEISAALSGDDFPAVERAAGRMGYSEQMGRMCTHMGAGAPGFAEQALRFHHAADRIVLAARERDRKRVLTELGATLQTCTSCHATFKQEVVDAATFQRLTTMAASPAGLH